MCKKLTKLVSESEGVRQELDKYRSAYGDIEVTQSPEARRRSSRAREAEVKAHLKLVEEEATLLSRRIVELEVENRGLRAEMSDLRETGGEEEEQEKRDVAENREGGPGYEQPEDGEDRKSGLICNPSQDEGMTTACRIPREGPVGGEWEPLDSQEGEKDQVPDRRLTVKDCESLLALRDHSCILSSAVQLLTKPPEHDRCPSPSWRFSSRTDGDSGGAERIILPWPLSEALELLQAMLLEFIGRVETLLTGEDLAKNSQANKGGRVCDGADGTKGRPSSQEQVQQAASLQGDNVHRRNPKMQLTLQILWILHQWCQVKAADVEEKEVQF